MLEMMGTVPVDGARAYLRTLRKEQKHSQEQVAEAAGLSLKGYTDWEAGRTEEMRAGPLLRAVSFLRGSAETLRDLVTRDAPADEGERMARAWLALSQEERNLIDAEIDAAGGPAPYLALLNQLRAEMEQDPGFFEWLRGVVAGRHTKP